MHFSSVLIAAIAAATSSMAAPAGPIVPPANPPANAGTKYCRTWSDCLSAINTVRSDQEGLAPIALPTNWWDLTYQQRVFTFINIERTSRNLQPITHAVNTYDSQVNTGVTNDADPVGPRGLGSWGSIWAGGQGMFPLSAMYLWMYVDGPGGNNIDCTDADQSGCWGHRDIILSANMNKIDVGAGKDNKGKDSFAALLFTSSAAPAADQTVLDWDTQKAKLAAY